MAVVDIILVRTQLLEKLMAGPNGARYTDALGANSDYESLDELRDNILIIDSVICQQDIIGIPDHPSRNKFMVPSNPLVSGSFVPEHTGAHGDVQVSVGGVYDFSQEAKSRAEILSMRANLAGYGGNQRFHYIENGVVDHCGEFAKVWYPSFTKTALCQTPEAYTDVVLYGSIQLSEKYDQESSFFKKYEALYMLGRQLVRLKVNEIPPQQILEAQVRQAQAA